MRVSKTSRVFSYVARSILEQHARFTRMLNGINADLAARQIKQIYIPALWRNPGASTGVFPQAELTLLGRRDTRKAIIVVVQIELQRAVETIDSPNILCDQGRHAST